MSGGGITRGEAAVMLGVFATFALDVYSTLNSSPQTTELFAGDREESLMHWVVIGDVVAIGGGAVGAVVAGKIWPLVAALIVAAGMHYTYRHAVSRGTGEQPPAGSSGYGS